VEALKDVQTSFQANKLLTLRAAGVSGLSSSCSTSAVYRLLKKCPRLRSTAICRCQCTNAAASACTMYLQGFIQGSFATSIVSRKFAVQHCTAGPFAATLEASADVSTQACRVVLGI